MLLEQISGVCGRGVAMRRRDGGDIEIRRIEIRRTDQLRVLWVRVAGEIVIEISQRDMIKFEIQNLAGKRRVAASDRQQLRDVREGRFRANRLEIG